MGVILPEDYGIKLVAGIYYRKLTSYPYIAYRILFTLLELNGIIIFDRRDFYVFMENKFQKRLAYIIYSYHIIGDFSGSNRGLYHRKVFFKDG